MKPPRKRVRTHGLTHLNLAVRDLERSLHFHRTVFGVKEYYRDASSVQVLGRDPTTSSPSKGTPARRARPGASPTSASG